MNAISFYKNDEEFKTYVDKYSTHVNAPVEECLKHQLVLSYMKYLLEKRNCTSKDLITYYQEAH